MKIIMRRLILFAYLGVLLASVLMVIKPGASIFFHKIRLESAQIRPDIGQAHRYGVNLNPIIFLQNPVLLFEDDQSLTHVRTDRVVDTGLGSFSLEYDIQGNGILYFAATDNSHPATNGHNYVLFLPIAFFARERGLVYLTICALSLIWFIVYWFRTHQNPGEIFSSPTSLVWALDDFVNMVFSHILVSLPGVHQARAGRVSTWLRILPFTIVVSYGYVLMEWLFFVTKPSFMDLMSLQEKIEVFALSGFGFSVTSGLMVLFSFGLDSLFRRVKPSANFLQIGVWIPALILASLALIWIDNFTYTINKFGIVNTVGYWRGVYAIIFIILFLFFLWKLIDFFGLSRAEQIAPRSSRSLVYLSGALLAFSLLIILVNFNYALVKNDSNEKVALSSKRPDILLIGGDGLNSEHLSVYGYSRDTTPNLRNLAPISLLAENAFTNSAHSSGSVISILTSKLPTQTRVLGMPDILKGSDAYQHLPGLLKRAGYYTAEIGIPYYVDAYATNLLDGFDVVNGRQISEPAIMQTMRTYGFGDAVYFTVQISSRILKRLNHIFYIKVMENPFEIVTKLSDELSDQNKINELFHLLDNIDQPLFIHVHLSSTHGSLFNPRRQVFSDGQTQDQTWMTDFYDDAILDWDQYIGDVIDYLEQSGKSDNTILIIYTDHGMGYTLTDRIPLIIHFPYNEHAGRIQSNVQNLDIAPTILDYLGLAQPDWMNGHSMLQPNPNPLRIIFSAAGVDSIKTSRGLIMLDRKKTKPPFYQFAILNLIQCQNWYQIDLISLKWEFGKIKGHTEHCDQESLFSMREIQEEALKHLSKNGFDISSIP